MLYSLYYRNIRWLGIVILQVNLYDGKLEVRIDLIFNYCSSIWYFSIAHEYYFIDNYKSIYNFPSSQ